MAESESDDFASAESDTEVMDLLGSGEEEAVDSIAEKDSSGEAKTAPKQDEPADKPIETPSDKSDPGMKSEQSPSMENKPPPTNPPPTETPPLSDTSSRVTDPSKPESSPPTASKTISKSEDPETASSPKAPETMSKSENVEPSESSPKPEPSKETSGGWGGWGGWGGSLWSSVSTVAESAQAIGQKMTAVIASVEDSLGVPSPEELAMKETDQETLRLADEIKEHDVSPEDLEPVKEEPHHHDKSPPASEEGSPGPTDQLAGDEEEQTKESNFKAVSGFFSGFAAAVQSTGHGLVSGGLDALETIGKKTMEVLSEGDPGLAKKRAMLGMGPSPSLSQLLKEAKAESAAAQAVSGDVDTGPLPLTYSRLFDEYHGVGHLEALELLSKECAGKAHSAMGGLDDGDLQVLQDNLEKLSQAFNIDEDQENLDDDSSQLEEVKELFSEITLPLKADKLIKVSSGWREKVDRLGLTESDENQAEGEAEGQDKSDSEGKSKEEEGESKDESEDKGESKDGQEDGKALDKTATSEMLYENGLRSLAELTSTSIELFRKMAEISLLPDITKSGALQQAQKFNRLTVLVSNELDALASVHSEAITLLDLDGTNANVTSLYLESSNSGSYVQDAFQLLLPVLKLSMLQELQTQEPELNVLNRN